MKKFLPIFLFVFITGLVLSNNLFGQLLVAGNASDSKAIKERSHDISHDVKADEVIITPAALAESNVKLSTRFKARFPGASMAQWTNGSEAFYVTFLNNGRKAKACFTSAGRLNYTVTECTLEQLPASLRKNILAGYKTYTLFNAIEIDAYGSIAHQVILENATGFITLGATEEGVSEIQQVTKGATL